MGNKGPFRGPFVAAFSAFLCFVLGIFPFKVAPSLVLKCYLVSEVQERCAVPYREKTHVR